MMDSVAMPPLLELGKVAWLWMNSPLHDTWPLHSMAAFALPPITLGQMLMVERNGLPAAYCSWAWFNADAEARYIINPSVLRCEDWKCGDRLWFIDWVAPFATRDSWQLKCLLAQRFGDQVARAIRIKPGGGRARVMEFRGRLLDRERAQAMLAKSYADFIDVLRGHAES